jgi:hypothetical protein
MRMSVLTVGVVVVPFQIDGPERQPRVTVRPTLVMLMGPYSVPVLDRVMHDPIMPSRARRMPAMRSPGHRRRRARTTRQGVPYRRARVTPSGTLMSEARTIRVRRWVGGGVKL